MKLSHAIFFCIIITSYLLLFDGAECWFSTNSRRVTEDQPPKTDVSQSKFYYRLVFWTPCFSSLKPCNPCPHIITPKTDVTSIIESVWASDNRFWRWNRCPTTSAGGTFIQAGAFIWHFTVCVDHIRFTDTPCGWLQSCQLLSHLFPPHNGMTSCHTHIPASTPHEG